MQAVALRQGFAVHGIFYVVGIDVLGADKAKIDFIRADILGRRSHVDRFRAVQCHHFRAFVLFVRVHSHRDAHDGVRIAVQHGEGNGKIYLRAAVRRLFDGMSHRVGRNIFIPVITLRELARSVQSYLTDVFVAIRRDLVCGKIKFEFASPPFFFEYAVGRFRF